MTDIDVLLVIGSYGDGLSLVAMRPDGSLTHADRLALRNPAYLRPDPSRDLLYAALETNDAAGIATVAIDRAARRLTLRAEMALPGTALCHLDLSPDARWIAGACYGSGDVIVRRIGDDGIPVAESGVTLRRRGSGPHPVRQTQSHPHAARFSPDGRWLLVPDLGTDHLALYPFDAGTLGAPQHVAMPPGSGPRLVLFDAAGRHIILLHELSSAVTAHAWRDGTLAPRAQHSALVSPPPDGNTAAGLRWHPSGRLFAASNRGADSITLFRYDPADGAIVACCEHKTGGVKPRDFEFMPGGDFLLCANQASDSLVMLRVDPDRCTLTPTDHALRIGTPSCVRVLG